MATVRRQSRHVEQGPSSNVIRPPERSEDIERSAGRPRSPVHPNGGARVCFANSVETARRDLAVSQYMRTHPSGFGGRELLIVIGRGQFISRWDYRPTSERTSTGCTSFRRDVSRGDGALTTAQPMRYFIGSSTTSPHTVVPRSQTRGCHLECSTGLQSNLSRLENVFHRKLEESRIRRKVRKSLGPGNRPSIGVIRVNARVTPTRVV